MSYDATNFTCTGSHNGYAHYRYDTLEFDFNADASGYFNNSDDTLNLAVGDLITLVRWTTAVRTGTIADVSMLIVVSVDADGTVDCSNDFLSAGIVDTD